MIAETIIAAVMAGNAVCSDHFESSRPGFNHADFSQYGYCILDTVRADEVTGVDFNRAWVRIDGTIYSVSINELVRQGSKERAIAYFKKRIGYELAKDSAINKYLEEQFKKLEEQGQELTPEIMKEIENNIPSLEEQIEMAVEYQNEVGDPIPVQSVEVAVEEAVESVDIDTFFQNNVIFSGISIDEFFDAWDNLGDAQQDLVNEFNSVNGTEFTVGDFNNWLDENAG